MDIDGMDTEMPPFRKRCLPLLLLLLSLTMMVPLTEQQLRPVVPRPNSWSLLLATVRKCFHRVPCYPMMQPATMITRLAAKNQGKYIRNGRSQWCCFVAEARSLRGGWFSGLNNQMVGQADFPRQHGGPCISKKDRSCIILLDDRAVASPNITIIIVTGWQILIISLFLLGGHPLRLRRRNNSSSGR